MTMCLLLWKLFTVHWRGQSQSVSKILKMIVWHRPEQWSIFQGNRMVMVVFLQRWNGDGHWKFSPSPSMVPGRINHWQRWFFNGFSNFGDQWFTMVDNVFFFHKKMKFATKCALIKMSKTETHYVQNL